MRFVFCSHEDTIAELESCIDNLPDKLSSLTTVRIAEVLVLDKDDRDDDVAHTHSPDRVATGVYATRILAAFPSLCLRQNVTILKEITTLTPKGESSPLVWGCRVNASVYSLVCKRRELWDRHTVVGLSYPKEIVQWQDPSGLKKTGCVTKTLEWVDERY